MNLTFYNNIINIINIINDANLSKQQKYDRLKNVTDTDKLVQALADDYANDYNTDNTKTQADADLIEMFNFTDGSNVHDRIVKRLQELPNGQLIAAQLLQQEINNDAAPVINAQQSYRQGHTNECWLVAALFSLAQRQDTRDIMRRNIHAVTDENGQITSYKVIFAGDNKNNVYTVTPAEILEKENNGDISRNDATAPTLEQIIETAMYKYTTDNPKSGLSMKRGGRPEKALKLLTNQVPKSTSLQPSSIALQLEKLFYNQLSRDSNGNILRNPLNNSPTGMTDGLVATITTGCLPSGGIGAIAPDRKNIHTFILRAIDWDNKIIHYNTPWNTTVPKKISFDAFDALLQQGSDAAVYALT